MKTQVLTILRSADDYVSGQEICNKLGVSRTAVWKAINHLKDEGYIISAVSNRGYKIEEYPDILTQSEVASAINIKNTSEFGKNLSCNDVVDSTNNVAKKMAEDGAPHGTIVIAEHQTGGRGRRGRNWVSPEQTGIWMTYILRPDIAPDRASMLTLVAALAAADGIHEEMAAAGCGVHCKIKWPNDIVLNDKKIVGILTEMSADPDCVNYVAAGIGINVNTTQFSEDISSTASSILSETGVHMQRSRIIAAVSKKFEDYYATFIKTSDLSGLMEKYNSMLVNAGRQVRILEDGASEDTGTALGIDESGRLVIRCPDGALRNVVSGEVSVRGLYGYV